MKFFRNVLLLMAFGALLAGLMALVVVGIADHDSSDLQQISRDTLR